MSEDENLESSEVTPPDEPETPSTEARPDEQASSPDAPPEEAGDRPSDVVAAEEVPTEVAEEPASAAPEAEEPQAQESAPEAEEPQAQQTAPEATKPPERETAPETEELEPASREKPEIPGLELEPDIIAEAEQYLDPEQQAAAEAEAEARAAAALAEDQEEQAAPIADAAIDLGADARYTATGKRKTAVARVIVKPGTGQYLINGRPLESMFPRQTLQRMIRQPLETVGYESRMDVVARMHGGGVSAQAGALRHGISRALIDADPNLRGELKRRGFLTRDPRVKERKKAGLKKARKRPQFSKR